MIRTLILREFKREWRQRHSLNGIFLYLSGIIFICYLGFYTQSTTVTPQVWNVLFWIIMLFTAVNAIGKSFIQESKEHMLYLYSICPPIKLLIAKVSYNVLLMLFLSVVALVFYTIIMGNPIENYGLFFTNVILGSLGFSTSLTMVSSIAAKVNNNGSLMAVLGFPLLIPILLLCINISKKAIAGMEWASASQDLISVLSIDVIIVTISLMLFPYLWRT